VHEGGDGTGDGLRPHVFVTVSEAGVTNGVTITTTRRVYYITCKSVAKSPTRVLRWHYPPESQTTALVKDAPGLLPHPEQPMRYHVGYDVASSQKHAPDWMPRHAIDDGKKMFIVLPEVTLFGTAPMVRMIGPNGAALINVRQFLNVLILDQLAARLELRIGIGEHAEVVTITRGNLKTITCPEDADCPRWPDAARVLARREQR
jgi:type IV secretory pathway VirB9-like protein